MEPRTERALTECMSVLPEGADIYTVVGENERAYRVDTRENRCTCPDHEHRNAQCKHLRWCAFATGEVPAPAGIEGVDPLLGQHTETQPYDERAQPVVVTDGGSDIIVADVDGEILDDDDDDETDDDDNSLDEFDASFTSVNRHPG